MISIRKKTEIRHLGNRTLRDLAFKNRTSNQGTFFSPKTIKIGLQRVTHLQTIDRQLELGKKTSQIKDFDARKQKKQSRFFSLDFVADFKTILKQFLFTLRETVQ